jgi:hypothetical protein
MTKVNGTFFSFVIHKYVSTVAPSNYPTEMIQRANISIPASAGFAGAPKHLQLTYDE